MQIFGYVDHDTSGPNIGPTLKTQSFLLNEICVVTHMPNYCAKDNLQKKSTCDLGVKSTGLGMPARASKAKSILIGLHG